jgi:hypothetical protein
MNCRDVEPLLFAERDGALTPAQCAELAGHVATCAACKAMQARLNDALDAWKAEAATVTVPDVDEEWRAVRSRLHGAAGTGGRKRPLAPIIWFGSTLAAAAALVFALVGNHPKPAAPAVFSPDNEVVAEADAINATTMAYVDQESGWLVVWATDPDNGGKS